MLAFQLGLRVSELIALKWSDIADNTIYVQRQEICYTTCENGNKRTVHKIVEYTKTKTALERLQDMKTSKQRSLHITKTFQVMRTFSKKCALVYRQSWGNRLIEVQKKRKC